MIHREDWRKQVKELSNKGLIDELERPTQDWNQDVLRESIKRLLIVLPEIRDVSKCIVSMRESMSCAQPSNHGRKGTMPRSRKGCFKKKEEIRTSYEETDCGSTEEEKNPAR